MINKAILLGHVGHIESQILSNGHCLSKISLATKDSWKDKNTGEKQEKSTWHNIHCFSTLGEIAQKIIKVGDVVYIEGKINISKFTGKDGSERNAISITADVLRLVPRGASAIKEIQKEQSSLSMLPAFDDSIPF